MARDELRAIQRLRKELATSGGDAQGADAGEGRSRAPGAEVTEARGVEEADAGPAKGVEEADTKGAEAKGVEEADVLESALSAWGEAHLHREGLERFRGGPLALLTRARHETARRKVAHASPNPYPIPIPSPRRSPNPDPNPSPIPNPNPSPIPNPNPNPKPDPDPNP